MPTDQEMMQKPGMMSPGKTEGAEKKPVGGGNEGGTTTVPLDKYPELQGMAKGASVKGTWEGIIDSIDNDNAVISYTNLQLDTENTADKELNRITGSGKGGQDHKVGDEAEEEI